MPNYKSLAICCLLVLITNVTAEAQQKDPEIVDRPVTVSKYWIGLKCAPIPPALRSQLNLADDQGLLIEDAVPDNPAAKAGIKPFDILLKAGDKSVSGIHDVLDAVEKAKDSEMTLTILRGGKEQTIKVTPAERQEHYSFWQRDLKTVLKYFDELGHGRDPHGFGLRIVRPPVWVHTATIPNLPKNLKISIEKQGNEPAKINVERDGEKWQITEKELDKIPFDIRVHVRSLLGGSRVAAQWGWRGDFEVELTQPLARPQRTKQQIRLRFRDGQSKVDELPNVEDRLENVLKQLEELRESLKELQKSLPNKSADSNEGSDQ